MIGVFDEKTLLLERPSDPDELRLQAYDRAVGSLDFEPLVVEDQLELVPPEPMIPDQLPARSGLSDLGEGSPEVAASSAPASGKSCIILTRLGRHLFPADGRCRLAIARRGDRPREADRSLSTRRAHRVVERPGACRANWHLGARNH